MTTDRQSLQVIQIEQIDPWVRRYRLAPAHTLPLAPFQAGQYLNLFYQIDGSTTSRPYSIASSPAEALLGYYDLYIHGGGSFTSSWLFRHIQEGDTLSASLPLGEFHPDFSRDTRQIIGISGGMSVTPLRSMARAVADGSLDAELTLFCGWDTADEVLFREEFTALQARCPRFHVVFAVAQDTPSWAEPGFVTLEMIQRHVQLKAPTFFLCGPAAMYHSLAHELAPLAVPARRYHQELPGEVKDPAPFPDYPGAPQRCQLTVARGDNRLPPLVIDPRETLLVALERAGLTPPARCRSGQCGFCLSRLESGQIYVPPGWDSRTQEERAAGLIHPCCSFPLSDLVLHLDS